MLNDNLAMLRTIRGFSQEEVAQAIGISRQAYAKWENGTTVPDIQKCATLAKFYGTSIDSLISDNNVEGLGTIPPGPPGKDIWGSVTINDRGQLVIPKAARDKFNLKPGDRLIVGSDEAGIALIPVERFQEKMAQMIQLINAGVDIPL